MTWTQFFFQTTFDDRSANLGFFTFVIYAHRNLFHVRKIARAEVGAACLVEVSDDGGLHQVVARHAEVVAEHTLGNVHFTL